VVVCGLSGSGKSTVAQTVAEQLGAVRLRSDVERKRLLGLTPLQRPVGDAAAGNTADAGVPAELLYSAQATERTYARLLNLAQGLLSAGVSVVVDAACLREHERRTLLDLAAPLRVPALLLRCTAPAEVLRQRVADRQQRNDDASDAGPAVLERQLAFEEALSAPELAQAWVLDTDMDRAALDAAVVAGLQRWVAG
jgi:predicted kinase